MDLFYREIGEGNPIVILHGLFGSSDNWISIGRDLATDHKVFLLDQRNHGNSFHSQEFNYGLMANDLRNFLATQNIIDPIVMGHSMGGKTAMFFGTQYPQLLKKLIVVDIGPRNYPIHHQEILEGLESIPIDQLSSRKEADDKLSRYVPQTGIRNFLLKNLIRNENGGFSWKLNLKAIQNNIDEVGMALPPEANFSKATLFIRGEYSDYIRPNKDLKLIQEIFPQSKVVTLPETGHWLHSEKPVEFIQLVRSFLE